MSKLAIIRIKGPVRVKYEVEDTMKMLHLNKKFNCVVIEDKPEFRGMIKKVEHLITWGKITDETIKLLEKRKKGKYFALHPPKGGFERKGTKIPFKLGGAYGYRKDKINDLIQRML
ncbi:uL30 family ribosomal protein [Candidatus Woesearchaeota archaeon]|nr:uL30 family ribosomal protein [Candidatus Woesearchaeota archaeon]MBW2994586.1 uL30 family ribosomal protein [Candidatus Woesearchaeota archaeon]